MCTKSVRELQKLEKRLLPLIPNISCPVYAVWAGNDDKVDPKSAEILRDRLTVPYTECTVPDCPHGSTYCSKRDLVYEPAMRWLDDLLSLESAT